MRKKTTEGAQIGEFRKSKETNTREITIISVNGAYLDILKCGRIDSKPNYIITHGVEYEMYSELYGESVNQHFTETQYRFRNSVRYHRICPTRRLSL